MLKKSSGQIDIFNHMIYDRLIPKNHLLVKIDAVIDFSFVYEKLEDRYSKTGRGSKDPVMMTKLLLLEYIYNLSDVEVRERTLTDIAFSKVIKETSRFNERLAKEQQERFEADIQKEYENKDKVSAKKHFEIAQERLEYLYLRTYEELQVNHRYRKAFGLCHDLVSEIILASVQTPFNVGDEKKLQELVEKVEEELDIKPKEITADKVYGTIDNRAYLKDKQITANIAFYKESSRENQYYAIQDFEISKDLSRVICPNGKTTETYRITHDKKSNKDFKQFKSDEKDCQECPLKEQCLYRDKNGKLLTRGRRIEVPMKYDVILADRERATTSEFKEACNKRFIVERRFATMVRKRGLRRCRYLGLQRAKAHIIMANMACNIVRMVNLLFQPSFAMT
jgi:IS5 family transposase